MDLISTDQYEEVAALIRKGPLSYVASLRAVIRAELGRTGREFVLCDRRGSGIAADLNPVKSS